MTRISHRPIAMIAAALLVSTMWFQTLASPEMTGTANAVITAAA